MIRLSLFILFFSSQCFCLTHSVASEDPTYQNDVFISTSALADDGSPVNGYCNASLISAQVLVTAAHCVAESLALQKNQIHIEVGAYKYIKQARIGYVPLFKKDVSAQFVVSNALARKIQTDGIKAEVKPDEDLAIVILAQKLDLDPAFVFSNIVPAHTWEQIRAHRNLAQFSIASINYWDTTTDDYKRSAVLDKFSFIGGVIQSQSTSRVEEGDSGSPVFARFQNQNYLVGVVKGLASILGTWNWDVFPLVVGKICDIAKENSLNAETITLVCK